MPVSGLRSAVPKSLDPSLPKLTYLLTMRRLFPLVFGTFLAGASFLSAAISEPVRAAPSVTLGRRAKGRCV